MTSAAYAIVDEITAVARRYAGQFRQWTSIDDIIQELHIYALAEESSFQKYRADGEGYRVDLALSGAARQFCEQQKAQASGYEFSDVAWYSPQLIEELLPLALSDDFDGTNPGQDDTGGRAAANPREGGTLTAMVADVRAALANRPAAKHVLTRPFLNGDSDEWTLALDDLSHFLGGQYPAAPGYRRRAMTNAQAQAITRNLEAA